MKKVIALLLSLIMVTAVIGGCSSKVKETETPVTSTETNSNAGTTDTAAKSDEPFLIGTLYPLTGDVSPIGNNIMRGVEFAVEEINAAGGVNGRPIEIVRGDTQGDPKVGMSEAERLISQEKVVCLLGAYQSSVTEVVSQIAEKYQVPLLTAISTANQLTTHGYEYFFRLAPNNMMFLRDMVQFLSEVSKEKDEIDVKSIAVCADNTLLGQETAQWAKYWAKEYGIEYLGEVLYTKGTADMSSEVLQLQNLNPDALVVDNYISDGILLTKTLNEQGYKPKIMIAKATAYIDSTFIPNVGALGNGITTAAEFNPGAKGVKITDAFFAKYGVQMNGHSAEAYTAVWTLKTAIEQAESTDSEAIKEALASIKIEGSFPNGPEIILPYDVIEFSDTTINDIAHKNTNTGAVLTILQIQDGKYQTVWPFNIKTADYLYPAIFK